MDLDKCRILVSAIELGSISAAAACYKMTPSGISRIIAGLEEEFGFPLLVRNRGGVLPTKNCEDLLPNIRDFIYYGSICEQKSNNVLGLHTGQVVIGVAHRFLYAILAKITKEFKECYPDIDIQIYYGYSSQLVKSLMDHECNLCFISKREGNYQWIELEELPMVVWVHKDHILAKQSAIGLSVFEHENYICTYRGEDTDNARLFNKYHIQPNIQLSTMDSFATYELVKENLGISLNNSKEMSSVSDIVSIPLEEKDTVSVGIAHLSNMSPATQIFLDFSLSFLHKL